MRKLRNLRRAALRALVLGMVANVVHAQVGIGTETPQEKLHVHDGSFLITTPDLPAQDDPFYDPGTPIPMQYRFYWNHDKNALRSVGERLGTGTLDPQYIGAFSLASGYETWAPGLGATALGLRTNASGHGSLAVGYSSFASSAYTLAVGYDATASGLNSVAIGDGVSSNGKSYSFVFGAAVSKLLQNDADRQMMMCFPGGYKFYSTSAASVGVSLNPNDNAWSVISDVNKKENFAPVNGEDFLQKISKMNLTSWNYKGQDPKQYRHYGPMAQDFYKAFGRDAFGTIGTDTTINQADFDGVNLIAVQALIRRMEEMSVEIATIRAELAEARSDQGRKKKRILASQK